jgi:xanthine dehydrogenase iron-sulfur cluster and FAD-binding subunit A
MGEHVAQPHHQLYQMTNSHILVQDFDYYEPASLEEAISLLNEWGDRAHVLAGGTYLLVQMKMERLRVEHIINIGTIPELSGIVRRDDGLHVGALTTIRAIRNAPQIWTEYTALSEACAAFGSTQIQMMGTVGGNLCSGSPASDTVPALIAFDAQLVLVGPNGEEPGPLQRTRSLFVQDFLLGPSKTALQRGELLKSILLPRPQPGTGSAFVKVSRVAADLAKVNAAAVLVREGDRIADCRLALGSAGPTVLRARRAEAALMGQVFGAELALRAGQIASEEIAPIDDVRSTAWYRREVVKAAAHDALQLAWQRAGEARGQGDKETRGQGERGIGRQGDRGTGRQGELGNSKRSSRVTPGDASCTELRTTRHEITLTVNGVTHRLWVKPNELLLNILRERLHLTGTKYGCGIGECGACTVLLDGKPALSCLVLAVSADGKEVVTVEGLESPDGKLDPLQEAFIDHAAFQCGYCTPGILLMSKDLLQENPSPTEDDVRDHLKGNRCRCTGFASIVRAVMSCAGKP